MNTQLACETDMDKNIAVMIMLRSLRKGFVIILLTYCCLIRQVVYDEEVVFLRPLESGKALATDNAMAVRALGAEILAKQAFSWSEISQNIQHCSRPCQGLQLTQHHKLKAVRASV